MEAVKETIERAWSVDVVGSPMFQLFHKHKHCRHKLVKWHKAGTMNLKEQINRPKEHLANLKEGREEASNGEIPKLEEELTTTYEYEECYWKEKSRVNWLMWGDKTLNSSTQDFKLEIGGIRFGS